MYVHITRYTWSQINNNTICSIVLTLILLSAHF